MTTITLEIPSKYVNDNKFTKNKLDIKELFDIFWIDLDFLIKERNYQNEFLNDIKNNNYIKDNSF